MNYYTLKSTCTDVLFKILRILLLEHFPFRTLCCHSLLSESRRQLTGACYTGLLPRLPARLAIIASCVASCTTGPVFRFAWSSVHIVIVDGGEGGAGEHGGGEVGHHGGQGEPGQPCCREVQSGKALSHEPGNHEVLEE